MRLRCEGGVGLLELLIAMVILGVAILVLIAALSRGAASLHRSGRTSTAAALADSQLELYRALRYSAIGVDATALAAAEADGVYLGHHPRDASGNLQPDFTLTCAAPLPPECKPSRTASGPDRQSYRIDTYVTQVTPPGGRSGKQVTVVVRDGTRPGAALAKVASLFDPALG
jgi:type II secretory pathway pseudopilin PulG